MLHDAATPTDPTMQRTRSAGIAIATAAIVSTIFVALDRSGGGNSQLEVLQGIARLQGLKELVHAVAIASVCAFAFGYATLARRLGLQRPLVLAGLTTECCVASSAWQAFERDFHVFIATDACAAYDGDLHGQTLKALQASGAILAETHDFARAWNN